MDNFFNETGAFICLALIWFLFNILKLRLSLLVAITGTLYFAFVFLSTIKNDNDFNGWSLIYLLVCLGYIVAGGKKVAYKTQTAVFDEMTGKPIKGVVLTAGNHFVDPLLEKATISTDGEANISADMQELEIEVKEIPEMQTATPGIQAKVKDIVFMLELHGNISLLFNIEGGAQKVRDRIDSFVLQFFHKEVAKLLAEKLDQDKDRTIVKLCSKLKVAINEFCHKNRYPYLVVGEVTIGDTKLSDRYYEFLSRKAEAILEQNAQDEISQKLTARLIKVGNTLLPGKEYSDSDRKEAAMVALGIVKKDDQQKTFGIAPDTQQLIKDIAQILKSK